MSRKTINGPVNKEVLPSDLPQRSRKLQLKCGKCGHVARYDVGCVLFNPGDRNEREREGSLLERLCFSGYFRCVKCNSAWPWEFPDRTKADLMSEMARLAFGMSSDGAAIGALGLFDGTICRSAAYGEDYLRERIAEDPGDFYLHNRLGNLYRHHGKIESALASYDRAVDLNPRDGESWYNLACLHQNAGRNEKAVHCFQQSLRFASHCGHVDPEELRCMVRDSLEQLVDFFELELEEGNADFLPGVEPLPDAPPPDPKRPVVYAFEFDLQTDEGWESLTDVYVYGSALHERARRGGRVQYDVVPETGEIAARHDPAHDQGVIDRRIPRNRPCPCGSGRKFKNCCGRSVPS